MPFSLALLNVFLYASCVFYLFQAFLTRQLFPDIPYIKVLFFAFLGAVLLSLLNAPSELLHMSFRGVFKLCSYMVFTLAVFRGVNSKDKIQKICMGFGISIFILSLDALFQYAFGTDLLGRPLYNEAKYNGLDIWRATGSYAHPNDLGLYLGTFFFILLAYAFVTGSDPLRLRKNILTTKNIFFVSLGGSDPGYFFKKWMLLGVCFISGLAIYFTFSRGTALAFGVCYLLAFLFLRKKEMILVAVCVAGVSVFFLPKDVYNWMHRIDSPKSLLFGGLEKENPLSGGSRGGMWKTAWNMYKAHPVMGVGFYTFSDQYVSYKDKIDPNHNIRAHNSFIELMAETGTLGLLSFLLLIGMVLFWALKNLKKCKDPFLRLTLLGFSLAFLSFLIGSTYESTLRSVRLAPFFWLLLGMILANLHKIQTKN